MNAVAKVVKFESLAEIKEPQETKVRMTENGYFEMPNSVVDDLAIMPDSTWKIYGIMIRKTYGWGKEVDCLATSQLMQLSGQSNKTVVKSCTQLEQAGLIEVIGFAAHGTKVYRIVNLTCEKITHAVEYFHSLCKKYTSACVNSTQQPMENLHTQKKTPQKKIKESISTAVVSVDTDSDNTLPAIVETEQAQPVAKKSAKPVDKEKRAANVACWNAYSIAYANRYGVDPIRNAKTNAMVAKFVEYVGRDDAPLIAAHYLTDNSFFYTNSGHDLSLMLRDFQKLRQQWITGRKSTATQARQADETQSRLSAFDSLAAKYAAEQE